MGMESPVGKSIDLEERPGKIIGVVEDFHFSSLHSEIAPLIIGIDRSHFDFLCIRVAADDIQGSLGYIEQDWEKFRSGTEFNYRFFDDLLGRRYRSEVQTGKIILVFTLVTVLVACLGLLGLSSYSAEQRTREIGVRKVLGASVPGVVRLLSKETLLLIGIATVLAVPVVWLAMGDWLESFEFRINMDPFIFVLAFLGALVIALLTVSIQALNAALKNPADSLRHE